MNANELAEIQAFKTEELTMWERNHTATMLRNQQAEIEVLKQSKFDGNNKVNNKPLAWIKQNPETLEAELHFDFPAKYWATVISNPDIPLYTHPVKELTDEEWNRAFDFYCETDEGVLKFDFELRDEWKKEQLIRWKEALRKAGEK